MATIQKRVLKTKTSWVVWWTDPDTGKRKSQSHDTNREARAFKATVEAKPELHIADSDAITVAEALKQWADICEKVGRHGREPVSPATVRKYRERAKNHLVPLIGEKVITKLRGPDIVRLRDDLLTKCGRPTAAKCLVDLKSALLEARTRGQMVSDPMVGIRIVDSSRARSRRPEIPSQREMGLLVGVVDARLDDPDGRVSGGWARYWAFLHLLRWSGMRPEEGRAFMDDDVLWDRSAVLIQRAADERGKVGPPKSAAGMRMIDVPARLLEVLRAWIERRGPVEGLMFPAKGGRPMGLENVTRRGWYPVLAQAGMPQRFPLYSLRHYRISERLAAKEDILTVSEQAGHEDPGFTLRVYGHVMREGMR